MRKAFIAITLAGIASSIVATLPTEASAQVRNSIAPDGKGIVGCALLGAEAVGLIEAAAGVHARWPYLVFPLIGAGAGAAGGYFLEQAASTATDNTLTGVSVATLVVGLGLLIPTTIAYVNATNYHPEADQPTEDNAPSTGPLEESGTDANGGANTNAAPASTAPAEATPATSPAPTPAATTPAPAPTPTSSIHPARPARAVDPAIAARRVNIPPSLFSVSREGFSMGVPAIAVGNAYSLSEVRQYNLTPVSELRVPLLSGTF